MLELSGEAAAAAAIESFPFDSDRPLLLQVSRFDPWKDPLGVIEAYRDIVSEIPNAQLALLGAMPSDDLEGIEVYRDVEAEAGDDPDIHLLTNLPDAGINGLQWGADVVLQKSLREGFARPSRRPCGRKHPWSGRMSAGLRCKSRMGKTAISWNRATSKRLPIVSFDCWRTINSAENSVSRAAKQSGNDFSRRDWSWIYLRLLSTVSDGS